MCPALGRTRQDEKVPGTLTLETHEHEELQ